MNRRIAIVTGSPLCRNPRVVKEATALGEAGYGVTVLRPVLSESLRALDAGIEAGAPWTTRTTVDLTAGAAGLGARAARRVGSTAVQYARWPAASALGYGVSQALKMTRALGADLTIGHQEVGLFVADRLAREGFRTGADVEDWYSEDLLLEDRAGRPVDWLRRMENATVRRGGFVTTTSGVLADALASVSGGPAPAVVYNVFPLSDRDSIDGRRLDRPAGDARPSLHWVSQTTGPGRGLETLFAALPLVRTPVAVHLRGALSAADETWVRTAFPADGGHGLYTHPLVPPGELLSRIAEHDIGLALESPSPPSRDLTVTNKLFHYLVGGLAVVATDTRGQAEAAAAAPEAVRLCTSGDPRSLAKAITTLVVDGDRLRAARAAALSAATSTFCWERQAPGLVRAVADAFPTDAPPRRRVLIVSPRFAPTNAPDMHRVRQSLPYLHSFGWEPTVLAVDPEQCEMPTDPWLGQTVPDAVEVVRTSAVDAATTRRFGFGPFDLRALPYLGRAGSRLLASGEFDLVFFSTTAFSVLALGPYWKRRFCVPYVLDLQDPWWSDYYDRPGSPPPPGGRLKFGVMQRLAKTLEPRTVRGAAHVVSVSPAYPAMLVERYPGLPAGRFAVLPFGAPEADVDLLRRVPVRHDVFDPTDGLDHWVYVGAAGPIMERSLTALFLALAAARAAHPDRYTRLRLHFVGTSYAPAGRERLSVEPVARACGVGDLVEERPLRVPYASALQAMLDADALLMPGSDDPGYTASKLYPTILARKPLLAVFHERSSVLDVLRETRAGVGVGFADGDSAPDIAARIGAAWFEPQAWTQVPDVDWAAFEPYTAREMTRRLADVFDRATA